MPNDMHGQPITVGVTVYAKRLTNTYGYKESSPREQTWLVGAEFAVQEVDGQWVRDNVYQKWWHEQDLEVQRKRSAYGGAPAHRGPQPRESAWWNKYQEDADSDDLEDQSVASRGSSHHRTTRSPSDRVESDLYDDVISAPIIDIA